MGMYDNAIIFFIRCKLQGLCASRNESVGFKYLFYYIEGIILTFLYKILFMRSGNSVFYLFLMGKSSNDFSRLSIRLTV